MIGYITVGADDLAKARRFYRSFLPALGYRMTEGPEGLSFMPSTGPDFYVKPPFDCAPASVGNGTMVAFEVSSPRQVRDLHAAALEAGGTNEGSPGPRAAYSPSFFVAYLRDPQGNKVALYAYAAEADPSP